MTEFDPLQFSQIADILHDILPDPVVAESLPDQTSRFIGGRPSDVVIDLTLEQLVIAEYSLAPAANGAPTLRPIPLGTLHWKNIPAWITRRLIGELTAAAMTSRREKYRECLRCQKETPPEEITLTGICRQCEDSAAGIVI